MNFNTYKLVGLILLLADLLAFSNDAPLIMGRNDEVINVQSTNISMREEVITITLRRDYYEVDVTFDFYNDGPEERVRFWNVWRRESCRVCLRNRALLERRHWEDDGHYQPR